MHRAFILAAAAAVPLLLAAPANAQTRGGAWCAGQTIGGDSWKENCTFRSFEACRREVVAGDRGICFQNPYRRTRAFHRSYARGWR